MTRKGSKNLLQEKDEEMSLRDKRSKPAAAMTVA
jgi:hypothetical protein